MRAKKNIQVLILISILLASFASAGEARACSNCCYCNCPQSGYTNTYIVQSGDTFSEIAKSYGVCLYDLWAANPHIWNINLIYPGQVIYVPTSSSYTTTSVSTSTSSSSWLQIVSTSYEPVPSSYTYEPLVRRSAGTAPIGTPKGRVKLINNANAEVYVSLQGTTRDNVKVINEYPVNGMVNANVPAGWYIYVVWVGGNKISGQFNLPGGSSKSMTIYIHKVVIQ